jgi:hypothetical protein
LINIFRYKLVLDSDAEEFGGHKRVAPGCEYNVDEMGYNDRPYSTLVRILLPFSQSSLLEALSASYLKGFHAK